MNTFFSKKDNYVLLGFFGTIVFIIVCVTILLTWYQEKDHTYATISELKTLKPHDIDAIIIKKYEKGLKFYKESLVADNIAISDADIINSIWKVVSFNNNYDPGHPVSKWKCYFEINRKNGAKYTLVINRLKYSKNLGDRGTLIRIWTHIDAGNIIGSFRCDELGTMLESIVKEKGLYNAKEFAMNIES
jgi:hypothetical protein